MFMEKIFCEYDKDTDNKHRWKAMVGNCKWQVEMHLARKTILHLLERKKWFNPPLLFEF